MKLQQIPIFVFLAFVCSGCFLPARLTPEQEAQLEQRVRTLLASGVRELRAADDESFNRAEAAFLLAKELKPNDARIYDGLGCVAFRRNNFDLAKYYFQQSIRFDRRYDRPVAHLALIAERDGNVNAARQLFEQAIAMNPLNYRARVNSAALEMRQEETGGDQVRAYANLLEAYQLVGQGDPILSHNLGIIRKRVSYPDQMQADE